jgi:uncharacterized membrane protein YoaK (UPF0700 family)
MLIAAAAGAVDAYGFVTLGGLFLSFMSGNLTRLGLAVEDGFWITAGLCLGLMLLFVGGTAAGTLIGRGAGRWRAVVLPLIAALLVAASAWMGEGRGVSPVPTLVIAMGLLNLAFPGLGLTYLTGALVRIGTGLAGEPSRDGLGFDLSLCLALATGVLAAARFHPSYGAAVLWGPAAALVLAALVQLAVDRPLGGRRRDPM